MINFKGPDSTLDIDGQFLSQLFISTVVALKQPETICKLMDVVVFQ